MKTTLDIDDVLLRSAKAYAARQGSSLTKLIEEGLQIRLRAGAVRAGRQRAPVLAVYHGKGGLVAGLNPTSNKSLLDALDGDSPG